MRTAVFAYVDQLCSNCAADQRFSFPYIYCRTPLVPKPLEIFCHCTAGFVLDLVGNLKDRFSRDMSHI